MGDQFLNLNAENIDSEHLCCIIRSKTKHPGVECKREWLRSRLTEGHTLCKLDAKGCCFIEYAPLEYAWVPVEGKNYLYIYCLWVTGDLKGKGYGRELMESCIRDARQQGKAGICMLGARKQKNWLSDQEFAKKHGFTVADTTDSGYELLALSFDGSLPAFTRGAKTEQIREQELTIFYSPQCPFIPQTLEKILKLCQAETVPIRLIPVDSLEKAKALPCPFNNWAVFYKGKFVTVNLLDVATVRKMIGKT